jgi:hypothetical protein
VNRPESDATASPHVPQAQLNLARSRERLSIPNQANTSPRSTPSPGKRTSPRPESQSTSRGEGEAPEFSPISPRSSRPFVTANQFVEPELLYGACEYPRSVIKTFAMLTVLDNSVRIQCATPGELSLSGLLAKCPRSSLWEGSTGAYSGDKLAETLEANGKTKHYSD